MNRGKTIIKAFVELRKGFITSKNCQNLGIGSIKFEPINLSVYRGWNIKELIKSQGAMEVDGKSSRAKGTG